VASWTGILLCCREHASASSASGKGGQQSNRRLTQTQRADGSWANQENLVKEDDPLIATAFAIRALVASGTR
jgi:hypothetical protein